MQPLYSLAYLTSAPLQPPQAIELAARLGYQAIGLRIMPAAPGGAFNPLIENPDLLRETVATSRDAGIPVFDVEIVRLAEDFRADRFEPFLAICAELGAKAILVAGDDPDHGRLAASYAAFCEAARPYGLSADLEFMPWTEVPDCRTALRIVDAAAQPNGGILVDALHVARSATTLEDLRAIPRHLLHYAQLCDAPPGIPATDAELIFTAREARLLPGEGGIDLAGILDALPRGLPLSVEIPHAVRKAELGVEEWSRQALARSRDIVAKAYGAG